MVECTALEMRHRCKPIGGSNPSLSASPADCPPWRAILRDSYANTADFRTARQAVAAPPATMTAETNRTGATSDTYCGCRCSAMKSMNALSLGVIWRLAGQSTLN